jgi:hypothetical protein
MLNSESKIYHSKSKICPTRYQQPATAAAPQSPFLQILSSCLKFTQNPESTIQNPSKIRFNVTRQQTFRFLRSQMLMNLLSTDKAII